MANISEGRKLNLPLDFKNTAETAGPLLIEIKEQTGKKVAELLSTAELLLGNSFNLVKFLYDTGGNLRLLEIKVTEAYKVGFPSSFYSKFFMNNDYNLKAAIGLYDGIRDSEVNTINFLEALYCGGGNLRSIITYDWVKTDHQIEFINEALEKGIIHDSNVFGICAGALVGMKEANPSSYERVIQMLSVILNKYQKPAGINFESWLKSNIGGLGGGVPGFKEKYNEVLEDIAKKVQQ